ncbi:MAG: hypothetical protein HC866_04315 [Leptolyngbyaceae cyanobacterium RU_5_1]|nr:hypothetical protein [Leptolyngbyaceae cyanobacterium RU_5_1]
MTAFRVADMTVEELKTLIEKRWMSGYKNYNRPLIMDVPFKRFWLQSLVIVGHRHLKLQRSAK